MECTFIILFTVHKTFLFGGVIWNFSLLVHSLVVVIENLAQSNLILLPIFPPSSRSQVVFSTL